MSSITTKGGDGGMSSLYSGERALKSDHVFEALGTLDELNSWIGVVKLQVEESWIHSGLEDAQRCLFRIASNLATAAESDVRARIKPMVTEDLSALEEFEDRLLEIVEMPQTFIIPGMEQRAAWTDVARTVCRRAERRVVALKPDQGERITMDIKYLNRLSDVLYVVARHFEEGGYQEK